MPDPDKPTPAGEPEGLYYFDGRERVALRDTGLAAVKAKPDRSIDSAKMALMFPASDDSLVDLKTSLASDGWALVNLDATAGGFKSALTLPDVDWILPIVTRADSNEPSPTRLAMTPRIVAGVVRREQALAIATKLGLVEQPSNLRGGLTYFRLASGPVRHDRIIEAANRLAEEGIATGSLSSAMPDFIPEKRRQAPPDDPRYGGQWHLDHGSAAGAAAADIDALEAWKLSEGLAAVRVAILDDSVQADHPDLKECFSTGRYYAGTTGGTSTDPKPRTGTQRHGTACAGVAVGAANKVGVRGSAPRCGLIGIHFWDASIAQTADAFRFAADPDGKPETDDGAHVISCSWSWNPSFSEVSKAVAEVATKGRRSAKGVELGVPVLFAAGNEYGQAEKHQWFATLPHVICVAASNWEDGHASYSNYGPTVSVCAPSSDLVPGALRIDTTDNTDDMPRRFGFDYSGYAVGDYTGSGATGFGGTSSATPLAAGVCALMLSANPNLHAWQVRSILEHTADRIVGSGPSATYDPTTSHDLYYGYGRVNALAAVKGALAAAQAPDRVWPLMATQVRVEGVGPGRTLEWTAPPTGAQGALVVQLGAGGWRPSDGTAYQPAQALPGGSIVLAVAATAPLPIGAAPDGARFAVFMRTASNEFAWGAVSGTPTPVPLGPVSANDGPTPARTDAGTGR